MLILLSLLRVVRRSIYASLLFTNRIEQSQSHLVRTAFQTELFSLGRIMTTFRDTVLILCLLSAVCFVNTSLVTHFERDWNITSSDLSIEDQALGKDNIATYAKCDYISNTERRCILVNEFLHADGFIFKNKCYANFHNDQGIDRLDMMKIRAAARGKVVISYINEHEEKVPTLATIYRVIDMTRCKYYESQVLFNVSQLNEQLGDKFWEGNVFLYEDGTFDTFLAQNNLCDGARCRVIFGPDGKIVGRPVSYLPNDMLAQDIKMFPFAKTAQYDEFYAVLAENRDGFTTLKLLHAYGYSAHFEAVLDLNDVVAFDVDNSQGVIAICWSKNKSENLTAIECRQYSVDNQEAVSASFELPYRVKTLKVKNTWAGQEFLVLTDECEVDSCDNDGRYYVRLINRSKLYYSFNMEISDLNCPGTKKEASISVYKQNSKDDKICVSVSCQRFVMVDKSYNNIKLVRKCFSTKYIHEAF